MTPLPGALGTGAIHAWRLDQERFTNSWDSGEGAFLYGGRWNKPGTRVVYGSIDPATAILEVAVHKTFPVLDTVRHGLTAYAVIDHRRVHVVRPQNVPNPNWLRPGLPSAGQQAFGDALLAEHLFLLIPSAVSSHSWNLIFEVTKAKGAYRFLAQEPFALDTRLHPAARPSR